MADLSRLTCGLDLSREDVVQIGKNVLDAERLFNTREGVTRADDTLPKRYFDDPMPLRMAAGHRIEREGFGKMLEEYYALRGWTKDGMLGKERKSEIEGWLAALA